MVVCCLDVFHEQFDCPDSDLQSYNSKHIQLGRLHHPIKVWLDPKKHTDSKHRKHLSFGMTGCLYFGDPIPSMVFFPLFCFLVFSVLNSSQCRTWTRWCRCFLPRKSPATLLSSVKPQGSSDGVYAATWPNKNKNKKNLPIKTTSLLLNQAFLVGPYFRCRFGYFWCG